MSAEQDLYRFVSRELEFIGVRSLVLASICCWRDYVKGAENEGRVERGLERGLKNFFLDRFEISPLPHTAAPADHHDVKMHVSKKMRRRLDQLTSETNKKYQVCGKPTTVVNTFEAADFSFVTHTVPCKLNTASTFNGVTKTDATIRKLKSKGGANQTLFKTNVDLKTRGFPIWRFKDFVEASKNAGDMPIAVTVTSIKDNNLAFLREAKRHADVNTIATFYDANFAPHALLAGKTLPHVMVLVNGKVKEELETEDIENGIHELFEKWSKNMDTENSWERAMAQKVFEQRCRQDLLKQAKQQQQHLLDTYRQLQSKSSSVHAAKGKKVVGKSRAAQSFRVHAN